jgi:hypothetical protein
VDTEVCLYDNVGHGGIVPASIGFAIQWSLGGGAQCPSATQLPACPL